MTALAEALIDSPPSGESPAWIFPADVPGWLTEEEGRALADLAAGKCVLEIGSYHGRSTVAMAQTAEHVFSIDHHRGDAGSGAGGTLNAFLASLDRYRLSGRVGWYCGTAQEYLMGYADHPPSFDCAFVDAAHDYASVRADVVAARRLVRDGGLFAFHDYRRWPTEYDGGWNPGVTKLVDELIAGGAVLHARHGTIAVLSIGESVVIPQAPADGIAPARIGEALTGNVTIDPAQARPDQTAFISYIRRPGWKPVGEEDGKIMAVTPSWKRNTIFARTALSLLNYAFNKAWAAALNRRKREPIHFKGFQHDDIVPALFWADIEMDEAERVGADIIAAVVPIKDPRGLTTTGVRNRLTGDIRRLTMTEIFQLPETFGLTDVDALGIRATPDSNPADEDLLINTGVMVCRFDGDWVEPKTFPGFRVLDQIRLGADGEYEAVTFSEDWLFSVWAQARGLKVLATRKVALGHWQDGREYRNDHVWGTCTTDPCDV